MKQHKSSERPSVMGRVGLRSKCPAAGQGPAPRESPLCGHSTEDQVTVATEQDQGYPEKGCSSDYQPVDPGLSFYAVCVNVDTLFCVSSCILMVCPCVQTYCTQIVEPCMWMGPGTPKPQQPTWDQVQNLTNSALPEWEGRIPG